MKSKIDEQAARIASLEAEIEMMNLTGIRKIPSASALLRRAEKAESESSRLLRECEGLREALKPFADTAEWASSGAKEGCTEHPEGGAACRTGHRACGIGCDMGDSGLPTVEGHDENCPLQRARAALSRQEPAPKPADMAQYYCSKCKKAAHTGDCQPEAAPDGKELSAEVLEAMKLDRVRTAYKSEHERVIYQAIHTLAAEVRRLHKMNQERK